MVCHDWTRGATFKQGYKRVLTQLISIMPRPEKRQETRTIEITIAMATFNALVHLAAHTPLGFTENTVAAHLLVREVERMQKAGEYGLRMPTGPV